MQGMSKRALATVEVALALMGLVVWSSVAGGCAAGRWMSPREAYYIEMEQCEQRGDEEAVRRCAVMVDRKYERYWSEGKRYPDPTKTPGRFNR